MISLSLTCATRVQLNLRLSRGLSELKGSAQRLKMMLAQHPNISRDYLAGQ